MEISAAAAFPGKGGSAWKVEDLPLLATLTPQDIPQVGNKAWRLGSLARAGLPVPAGFCLPGEAYRQQVLAAGRDRLEEWIRMRDFSAIRDWISGQEIDPGLQDCMAARYRALVEQSRVRVAVRSSSTAEDRQGASFAGLYYSALGVQNEAGLARAVFECWASYWSEEAVAYRERAGFDHRSFSMAVLVQVMVEPLAAGVLFTRFPALDPGTAVAEFVLGRGEGLVSGEQSSSRVVLDRSTGKVLAGRGASGETDFHRGLDFSRLLALALRVEQQAGGEPQDIEWAMDASGALWVLQARPVTAGLQAAGLGLDAAGGWELTYDEPFSPLGCELAIQRYHAWVRGINASFKTAFAAEIREQGGLLYYRPAWRSPSPSRRAWMNFWRLFNWLQAGRIRRRYQQNILPDFERRLAVLRKADLDRLTTREVFHGFEQAAGLYLEYQFTGYAIGSAATLSASLLERACRVFFDDRPDQPRLTALDFLTGLPDKAIERELALARLGGTLYRLLPGESLDRLSSQALADLAAREPEVGDALERFLEEYGYIWADRYPRDPAWELNQEMVVSALAHAARSGSSLEERHSRQQDRRSAMIELALARLSNNPWLVWRVLLFELLLRRAESLFPHKEDRNHLTYQAMMAVRRYAGELGARLHASGLLETPQDIFYFTMAEIHLLLREPRQTAALVRQAARRREAFFASRQRVQNRLPGDPLRQLDGASGRLREMKGDACSPGLARGPARLVSGPGELQRVLAGEIVVCTQLRPAWSAVFSRAAGVVIEMGSLLSHGSTLAREYGIPVVINVAGITRMVEENDWLVVDGTLGRVAIERGV